MDEERLFSDKMAYFEYTIPFPFFDEKAVRAFYQEWADNNNLVVDMEVLPVKGETMLERFLLRDLKLRVDVANKTATEIRDVYVALRSMDYIEELEK